MKKLILTVSTGLILFCVSCKDDHKCESTVNPQAQKNLDAVHAIDKAVETGDVSKLGDLIAADAIDHGMMGTIRGLDTIKAAIAAVHTQATDMKAEILKEFADSNCVIQWVRYTGTSKMAMGSMPAGSKYDMTIVHVSNFINGKATEHWEYVLGEDMMKMMPPPPPAPAKK